MDPLRYPRIESQSASSRNVVLKATYSNLAERLDIEKQYVAFIAQQHAGANELLSAAQDVLAALVEKLRRAESDIVLNRTPSTAENGPRVDVAPDDVIAVALRSFKACEIQFTTDKVPLRLSNFHNPDPLGRWTGPGLLSSFGIDLKRLRSAGLNAIEVEFCDSLVGPIQKSIRFLAGENLEPLPAVSVSWPTSNTVRLDFSDPNDRTGDLFLLTRSTRRKRPDARHRGVAIVTMRFMA
jgi:hypothetical protein